MDREHERKFLIDAGRAALEESDQYLPTLIATDADGHTNVMVLAGGHPYDMILATLPAIRDMRPVALSLTVDSYMTTKRVDDPEALRNLYQGSLARAFEAGEPGVSEALIVNLVSPTEQEVITLPYTRTPNGVEWGEDFSSDLVDGRMLDVLLAVWS